MADMTDTTKRGEAVLNRGLGCPSDRRMLTGCFLGIGLSSIATVAGIVAASPAWYLGYGAYTAIAQCTGYLAVILLVWLCAGRMGRHETLGLRMPSLRSLCAGAGMAVLLYPLVALVAAVSAALFPDSVLDMGGSAGEALGAMSPWLRVLALAVAPGLGEELLCRGLLFSGARRGGLWCGVLVPAICFSLLHGNVQQCAYALAFGIALGLLREASGSVWPCMLAHAVFNTVSALGGGTSMRLPVLLVAGGSVLGTAACAAMLKRMLSRRRDGLYPKDVKRGLKFAAACLAGVAVNWAVLKML